MSGGTLVGRELEQRQLRDVLARAVAGEGSLVLLAGEAGVGKTRLATHVLAGGPARFVRGAAAPACAPYGPVTAAFREHLRSTPRALDDCGPLRDRLAQLLPELGPATPSEDRATLVEAIRCGLQAIVADRPAAMLLDDLQWSDEATLELLAALALALRDLPLLVVAAYRSDELARAHPLRRLRHDLRRDRALREVVLEPLDRDGTAALLADLAGDRPSDALVATVHDRTGGTPFFVEELWAALEAERRVRPTPEGLALDLDQDVPLPRTVRDAVLVQVAGLSPAARAAAEAAAVAGPRFDLAVVAGPDGEAGLAELLATGLVVETAPGTAAFRHPLTRDALYEDVPWLRRRALHRRLAEALDRDGGDHAEVAAHRLAARDTAGGVDALVRAIADRVAVHAHRDAARLGRQALDLWPEGERGPARIALLEGHARSAELAGDLAEAARAQREVVSARRAEGAGRALADAERRMAAIYALQGDRRRALVARQVAAEAFAANGLPGEAAAERLVMAQYHQSSGTHVQAVAAAAQAREEAVRAERPDLQARAMGLEGVARVKRGEPEGLETVRAGLSLALAHGLTPVAAEVYQRLGTAHEIAGDYPGARDALDTALGLCDADSALGEVCRACMAYVLRELGDWDEVDTLCRTLIAPDAGPQDTLVADGVLGAVLAWRGDPGAAVPLLTRCLETATQIDVVSMQCDSLAALAGVAAREGDRGRAVEHCRALLGRWGRSEDHHYAVWGLRWAAGWLAGEGELALARGCTEALSAIATSAGHPDALAALAFALAELALAEDDVEGAVAQFDRVVELHAGLQIPFERAQVLVRAAAAAAAAGQDDVALERLADAHALARDLGARPLAEDVVAAVGALDASLEDVVGRRAAAEHETAGLSPRELEVLRLVAAGLTNREVAGRLVLSTRTVDMHVRNILTKLRCRTRTEAATRAGELGLLLSTPGVG
ncbi:LuxR family transcriptional regulator [Conexibacter sp. SYSU D00693]|uniref:helix-turn-helix transcriptional regulator n=1 Tax=Conexibacter sp. SYSU D00693 TaxID=2812560 RepID=UPI00196B84E8|nr:LuxR family transcriptional regulator [Conexibacter sp. SYSU D00693]